MGKPVVGLVEKVKIIGEKGEVETLAKFDTGASNNSIDFKLAAEAGVGPVVSSAKIKSASAPKGYKRRPVVDAVIEVKGEKYETKANLGDREDMKYKVLIGRELIHKNFSIDVSKSHKDVGEEAVHPEVEEEAGVSVGKFRVKKNED